MNANIGLWSVSCQMPEAGISCGTQHQTSPQNSQTCMSPALCSYPDPRLLCPTLSNEPNQPNPPHYPVMQNAQDLVRYKVSRTNEGLSQLIVPKAGAPCAPIQDKNTNSSSRPLGFYLVCLRNAESLLSLFCSDFLSLEARRGGSLEVISPAVGGLKSPTFSPQGLRARWVCTPHAQHLVTHSHALSPATITHLVSLHVKETKSFLSLTMQYCNSHFERFPLKPRIYRIL